MSWVGGEQECDRCGARASVENPFGQWAVIMFPGGEAPKHFCTRCLVALRVAMDDAMGGTREAKAKLPRSVKQLLPGSVWSYACAGARGALQFSDGSQKWACLADGKLLASGEYFTYGEQEVQLTKDGKPWARLLVQLDGVFTGTRHDGQDLGGELLRLGGGSLPRGRPKAG